MAKVQVTPSPSEFGKNLQEKAQKATHYALWMTAGRIVSIIQNEIIPNSKTSEKGGQPVDRGAYRAGWQAKLIEKGAEVYNTLPYASIIEYGARAENIKLSPSAPKGQGSGKESKLVKALFEWVMRKGLETDEIKARQAAFAIARAMQQRGIMNNGQGLRILEKAMARAPDIFREEMAKALKKVGAA